eukprot:scaffold1970_cov396-Prasinococcus_capsulatus_cf.AAC.32
MLSGGATSVRRCLAPACGLTVRGIPACSSTVCRAAAPATPLHGSKCCHRHTLQLLHVPGLNLISGIVCPHEGLLVSDRSTLTPQHTEPTPGGSAQRLVHISRREAARGAEPKLQESGPPARKGGSNSAAESGGRAGRRRRLLLLLLLLPPLLLQDALKFELAKRGHRGRDRDEGPGGASAMCCTSLRPGHISRPGRGEPTPCFSGGDVSHSLGYERCEEPNGFRYRPQDGDIQDECY